jgi:hypothetical protein
MFGNYGVAARRRDVIILATSMANLMLCASTNASEGVGKRPCASRPARLLA